MGQSVVNGKRNITNKQTNNKNRFWYTMCQLLFFVPYCPIYKNCYLDIHGKVEVLSLTKLSFRGISAILKNRDSLMTKFENYFYK